MIDQVPIFAGLNEQALKVLTDRAREETFDSGSLVFREGEPGNRFFLIATGGVRVVKNFDQPDALELARLGVGEFFGEMCILETLPRSATVQADGACTLFSLGSTSFLPLYETMPDQYSILLLNIARDLSRRIRRLDEVFAARH